MKNLLTTLTAVFLIVNTFLPWQASAQSPEKMKYQAVIRDNNGHVVINQAIGMQISILQGDLPGTVVYTETQSLLSNAQGLTSTEIGTGTVVLGDFSTIDWANGPYFLQIETDPAGGTNYTVTGTNQLLSVPYAMHSKTADSLVDIESFSWSTTGNLGTNDTINFIGTTDSESLIFKVNNVFSGQISPTSDNTSYGYGAGGDSGFGIFMAAFGRFALSNNTGNYNTATGFSALAYNTSGLGNSAFGRSSLYSNTTGSENTAIGDVTLSNNETGEFNTAIGRAALYYNITGSSNTATGYRALYNNTQSNNTANGYYALYSNTTGVVNTAVGNEALYNNIAGNHNTANGNKALYSNTSGHWNTANGSGALQNNTTGEMNTANGFTALYNNIDGGSNTAIGRTTLYSNSDGDNNTAIGRSALYYNSSGYENTAIGVFSFINTTTAGRNVGVGFNAGVNNITGFYNTAVGWGSGPATSDIKNSTALGRGATTTAWNQIRIGNNIVTSIGGYTGWSNISDKRFKKAIQNDIVGLDFIMALEPVSYQLDMDRLEESVGSTRHSSDSSYKETKEEREFNLQSKIEKGQIRQSGFLAQDVEQAALSVGYDFSGVDKPKNENDFYGLRYAEFVVPLVKGMQEQQQIIDQQNALIEDLIFRIEKLENN